MAPGWRLCDIRRHLLALDGCASGSEYPVCCSCLHQRLYYSTQRLNPVAGENEVIDQGSANVTALGHFDPYLTHYLRAEETLADDEQGGFSASTAVQTFVAASKGWEADKPGSRIPFEGAVLERTDSSAGRNPYLNIRVDGELIRDHNDIYDPRIASFIRQLILISSQSQDEEDRADARIKMANP